MSSKYLIGIDLHGTLLDRQWEIKNNVKNELITALKKVKEFCQIYVCSGNDLTFVKHYIPEEIQNYFDGYILETGCVISNGTDEKIIIPKTFIKPIKELEKRLKQLNIKQVKYFARRLITISMFTKNEKGGIDPREIYSDTQSVVKKFGYDDKVFITHSNVSIDIIPRGYNKFTGMKYIAGGRKMIGIADSLNDYHMLLHADYGFMPQNHSDKLFDLFKHKGKKIALMRDKDFNDKDTILKSNYSYNRGVVDILNYINHNF